MTNYDALDEALDKLATLGPRHYQGRWLTVDDADLDLTHEVGATYEWPDGNTQEITGCALRAEWACRTTACLAGWVSIWAGWTPLCDNGNNESTLVTRAGVTREVQDVARELLDLTENEADELFYARDLDELREVATSLRERDDASGSSTAERPR